jgi:cytidylate kinase
MAIITITRQLAALGDETAQEIARVLSCKVVDRKTLDDDIKERGFDEMSLEKAESPRSGFWASLSRNRDEYIHHLRSVLLETLRKAESEGQHLVVLGRGSHAVFAGLPSLISLYLCSPFEVRRERVKNYFRCNDKRAEQILEQSDRERASFYRYCFEVDWHDSSLYTLCCNTSKITPAAIAAIVKELAVHIAESGAEEAAKAEVDDMILAQMVAQHVVYERGVPVRFLEVSARGGTVRLLGVTSSPAIVESALACAREVPGVVEAESDIQVVDEYNALY